MATSGYQKLSFGLLTGLEQTILVRRDSSLMLRRRACPCLGRNQNHANHGRLVLRITRITGGLAVRSRNMATCVTFAILAYIAYVANFRRHGAYGKSSAPACHALVFLSKFTWHKAPAPVCHGMVLLSRVHMAKAPASVCHALVFLSRVHMAKAPAPVCHALVFLSRVHMGAPTFFFLTLAVPGGPW